ncbi:CapA family protein [Kordiimonas sp. SCSIO 12610]|uniref:CapA family protein n=1 Tax=Kordiimonas sp. SCSIO 12610 TaxID=2829597 RepID=UPI002108738F|nr:CapA family protein [Kordiimonas sp. SCSIO 12610]UTW53982.1 CapA family protein [Kordiimonas sp. SCSIO 12610]
MKHFVILFLLLTFWNSSSKADITISGEVKSANGSPLSARVLINGHPVPVSANGAFQYDIQEAEIYQLIFSADDYYPMIHTFSHYELAETSNISNQLFIPSVSLVKQKPGRSLMVFGGDMMMGRRYNSPHPGEPILIREDSKNVDTKAILRHVKPYLSIADLAAVNLETQVLSSERKEKAPKSVTFFTPPEALTALKWAGVDYVTLGNNHTYDYLEAGLSETIRHLDNTDLAYSGADLTEAKALKSYTTNLNGTDYSFQGYVGWAGSGKISQAASGETKGGPPLGSEENIASSVKRDIENNTFPIVQYHGSLEYGDEPSLATETKMKNAIDQGAVMALVHHPHVYQGLEVYNGKLIAWSLGNFVFDQYFYAPQKSALLYVWMDGDKLHRAEVVPLYIKGYKPTPATGEMRNSILKRISDLSARRGTYLIQSGGHAVIDAANHDKSKVVTALSYKNYDNAQNQQVHRLKSNWDQSILKLDDVAKGKKYRLGTDLLSRGSFEAYSTFDAPDRSWLDLEENINVSTKEAYTGKKSLELVLSSSKPSTITGMRKFTRVFKAGNPMTISAMVKADEPVDLVFYLQRRKTRDGLFDALEKNPKKELKTVSIKPGEWQQINVDFDSPRVGTRSIRFLIEAKTTDERTRSVYIDDLALIEWQTPYLGADAANYSKVEGISHINVVHK